MKFETKVAKVEREFKHGRLKSGSGQKVTDPKQAIAIALSEARQLKNKNDLLPTKTYNNTLQEYGLSSLKNGNRNVNSPAEAKELASEKSGQSYTQVYRESKNYDRYGVRK